MKEVKVNLVINDLPMQTMEDNIVPNLLTINGRKYYELKEFSKRFKNHSESKIRRKLKLLERSNFEMYVYRFMNKLFVSESLLNLSIANCKKTNDIKGSYLKYLSGFEWDFFACVRYKHNLTMASVRQRMERLTKKLATKYRNNELRLFYTIEQNLEGSGYHAHFLLWLDNKNKSQIKHYAENSLRGKNEIMVNTFIERYNPHEGGIAYVLKTINLLPDSYDLFWKK